MAQAVRDNIRIPKVLKKKVPANVDEFERGWAEFNTQAANDDFAKKTCGAKRNTDYIKDGEFEVCTAGAKKGVQSYSDVMKLTTTTNIGSNMDKKLSQIKVGEYGYRRFVCYKDLSDPKSKCYVTIWIKRVKPSA